MKINGALFFYLMIIVGLSLYLNSTIDWSNEQNQTTRNIILGITLSIYGVSNIAGILVMCLN